MIPEPPRRDASPLREEIFIPPAPGTFSTITLCPSVSDIGPARTRAIRSAPEPTPNGTTSVIGREG